MTHPANVALTDGVLSWDYIDDPVTFAYRISAITNNGVTTERRTIAVVFTSPYDFAANGHTLQAGDVAVSGEYPESDWGYAVFGTSDGYALTQPNWHGSGSTAPGSQVSAVRFGLGNVIGC